MVGGGGNGGLGKKGKRTCGEKNEKEGIKNGVKTA